VSYVLTGGWPGNFQADVTVTNAGSSPLNGWEVSWTYGGNQNIYNSWGADISQTGPDVTAGDVGHNATIGAGQSVTFGIQGTFSGTNAVPAPIGCTA
jgi:endoglucanase